MKKTISGMKKHMAWEKTMAKSKLVVRLRGGASLVKCNPVFSWDSKYLFCCSGDTIKVFSTFSGECVRNLRGHRSPVSCVKVNPRNKLQIYSSSLDQTIIQWDYQDDVRLKIFHLHSPILTFWPLGTQDNALIALRKNGSGGTDVAKFFLPSSKKGSTNIKPHVIINRGCTDARYVAMGAKNEFVVCVTGRKMKIHSLKTKSEKEHFLDEEKFTCVACHPTDHCIATGSTDGKIHFWWNFMSHKKVVRTINHWHALPLLHLTFTQEGSYVLSGGYECVLVKWQYNSQHRDFLPRLGAPIRFVTCSPDNTMYATSHSDNVIQVISNSFNLVQVYQGLTRSHLEKALHDPIPTGLLIDPLTKAVVTNGKPGHLQFYSLHRDKQLFNLDIVCQNYISPENLQKPTTVTEITRAAFHERGAWLVTMEIWDDGTMTPELRLKFWQFKQISQTYVLNTCVETAHEKCVNTVEFRPCSKTQSELPPMVITTSEDGKFRLWTLVEDCDIYKSTSRWSCESVGFYRDLPAGPASFSEDGSLLAVGFTSTITLWDPETNAMRTTLQTFSGKDDVRHLEFGRGRCCHLLVSTTAGQLTVWDLLSCSVYWCVSLEVSVLVRDMDTDLMAAFTKHTDLFVFRPSGSTPVHTQSNVSNTDIIGAAFVPHLQESSDKAEETLFGQTTSQIYFMNADQMLLSLTRNEEEEKELETSMVAVEQSLPQPPMKLLVAERRSTGVPQDKPAHYQGNIGQPGTEFVRQMMSTAAHVLPPVMSLCGTFLQAILSGKSTRKSGEEEDSDDETMVAGDDQLSSDSDSEMAEDSCTNTNKGQTSLNIQNSSEQRNLHGSVSEERDVNSEETLSRVIPEDFSWLTTVLR